MYVSIHMYMYQYICMSITVECTNVHKHFMIQNISPTEICILFTFPYATCMHEYGIQNIHAYLHTYLQNIDDRHGNSNET